MGQTVQFRMINSLERPIMNGNESRRNHNVISSFNKAVNPKTECLCQLVNPYKPGVFLWDIGKQKSPRCDAAKRGVPSGAILFAYRNFNEKCNINEKSLLMSLKMKVESHPNDKDGEVHPSHLG